MSANALAVTIVNQLARMVKNGMIKEFDTQKVSASIVKVLQTQPAGIRGGKTRDSGVSMVVFDTSIESVRNLLGSVAGERK